MDTCQYARLAPSGRTKHKYEIQIREPDTLLGGNRCIRRSDLSKYSIGRDIVSSNAILADPVVGE